MRNPRQLHHGVSCYLCCLRMGVTQLGSMCDGFLWKSGTRGEHERQPLVGARTRFAEDVTESRPCGSVKTPPEKEQTKMAPSAYPSAPHLHICLIRVLSCASFCICKYMPVSVQISLVPPPLKSVCGVSAWEGTGRALWSSAGCAGTGLQGGGGCQPVPTERASRGTLSMVQPPVLCVSGQGERGVVSRVYFCACFLNKRKK